MSACNAFGRSGSPRVMRSSRSSGTDLWLSPMATRDTLSPSTRDDHLTNSAARAVLQAFPTGPPVDNSPRAQRGDDHERSRCLRSDVGALALLVEAEDLELGGEIDLAQGDVLGHRDHGGREVEDRTHARC